MKILLRILFLLSIVLNLWFVNEKFNVFEKQILKTNEYSNGGHDLIYKLEDKYITIYPRII